MKIQVSTTVKKEVEIELPHYTKSIVHFYKIISENEALIVVDSQFIGFRIELLPHLSPALCETNEESNETEFNEAFKKANDYLTNKAKL